MSDLEKYIRQNKEAFDDIEPSEALWSRLEKKLDAPQEKPKTKIMALKPVWIAAAAMILAILTGALFFLDRNSGRPTPDVAVTNSLRLPEDHATGINAAIPEGTDSAKQTLAESNTSPKGKANRNPVTDESEYRVAEEMYHYSQLIELKQKQIEVIKKQNPELYHRFLKDLESLEYSYDALREKQKNGINNEQLLEAMILNLKMQSELLNKQLEVTKHIKNKSENEKVSNL